MAQTQNRFLQSNITSNDLATETTLKVISDKLSGTLDVDIDQPIDVSVGDIIISDISMNNQTTDVNVNVVNDLSVNLVLTDLSVNVINDVSTNVLNDVSVNVLNDISVNVINDLSVNLIMEDLSVNVINDVSVNVLNFPVVQQVVTDSLNPLNCIVGNTINSNVLNDVSVNVINDLSVNLVMEDLSVNVVNDVSVNILNFPPVIQVSNTPFLPLYCDVSGNVNTNLTKLNNKELYNNRLFINNPNLEYHLTFEYDDRPFDLSYNTISGGGIIYSVDTNQKLLSVSTSAFTSGIFEIKTKRKFNLAYTTRIYFRINRSSLTSTLSSFNHMDIGLYDELGVNDGFLLQLYGDSTMFFSKYRNNLIDSVNGINFNINTSLSSPLSDNMFFFEFNNHMLLLGEIYLGDIRYLHRFNLNNAYPSYLILPLYMRVESGNTSGSFQCEFIDAKIITEYNNRITRNKNYFTWYSFNFAVGNNSLVSIAGIRYIPSNTAKKRRVFIKSIQYSPVGNGERGILHLRLNPIFLTPATWTFQPPYSVVQNLDSISNIATGVQIYSVVISANYTNGNYELPEPIEVYDGDEYVVCLATRTGQTGFSAINWYEE